MDLDNNSLTIINKMAAMTDAKNPTSFIEGLTKEGLAYFNSVAEGTFSSQAVAFLNAYWAEVGDQAGG